MFVFKCQPLTETRFLSYGCSQKVKICEFLQLKFVNYVTAETWPLLQRLTPRDYWKECNGKINNNNNNLADFCFIFFYKKSLELFQDCVLNARVQRDVCKVLIKCYWIFLHSSTGRR